MSLKHLMLEQLSNNKRNVRINFHKQDILEELVLTGQSTKDLNIHKIVINGHVLLFEVMNNWNERFVLKPNKIDNRNDTLLIIFLRTIQSMKCLESEIPYIHSIFKLLVREC